MRTTMRLGRIAGVPVGVHWSVLGVVALLVIGLSAQLPALFPGRALVVYPLAGVVAAVLFVLSLLAHEMAHAITARRNDVEVESVTLWLLGGVARLRGEATTPGADFRIAVVGPATSLVLSGVFALIAWGVGNAGLDALGVGVLAYLAGINLLLAIFNIIPAAPLDGGRILRAAVWAWRGDRLTATVWSARAGRVFGFVLAGLGLLRAVSGMGGGLWWILIGLFIVTVASAEEHQARAGAALSGIRVRDVMTEHPETVRGDATVAEFLQTALLRRHSAFPILDDAGRLRGLVTLNRLRAVAPERRNTTALVDIACPPEDIPTARPDEPLTALLPRMTGCADGRALVFTDDQLVGIITPSDISRAATLHGLGIPTDRGGADLTHG